MSAIVRSPRLQVGVVLVVCLALGSLAPASAAPDTGNTVQTGIGVGTNIPKSITTTINFDAPALANAATTLDAGSTYLAQGVEFVDPTVQPVSHPMAVNNGGAYLYLDPGEARSGRQVLASYVSTDELLETLAGFLIHLTRFSDKISLYAGASSPNNPSIHGATVQMTGYDADGTVVATASKQVGSKVSTLISIATAQPVIAYVSVQIPGTAEPRLEVDDLTFVTPFGSALTATVNQIGNNGSAGNGPGPALIVPRILSVSQGVANPVTIVGDKSFADASAVYFGKIVSKNFQVTGADSKTLIAYPPSGMLPGSNARIAVLVKNDRGEAMVYSEQTGEISIGELDAAGPLLTDPYDNTNDQSWDHGQGRAFNLLSPKNLLVDTPYPVFYLLSQFEFTPSLETKYPLGLNGYAGNKAVFSAILEMCSIDGTGNNKNGDFVGAPFHDNIGSVMTNNTDTEFNFGGSCTNWDGTSGQWVIPGTWVTKSLTSSSSTYLGLPTGSNIFNIQNYVRTLRILGVVWLRDTQGDIKLRLTASSSPPFNVAVAPNAFFQIKVQPRSILFAPPGDQSTATVSVGTNFYTSYTTGNSKTQSNKETGSDNGSWNASLSMSAGGEAGGAKASASFTSGLGGGLDTTTTSGYAVQNGSQLGGSSALNITQTRGVAPGPNTIPGNGTVCASDTDCSTQTKGGASWWAGQPFWSDTFLLTVHPQYAFYVLGDKTDRSVMFASVAGESLAQVLDLWGCAAGVKFYGLDMCTVSYTDSSILTSGGQSLNYDGTQLTLELTPTEAKNLLALDPFYVGGQDANLPVQRAIPIGGATYYGTTIVNESANPVTINFTNTQVKQQQLSNQTTYTSSITNTFSSTQSSAFAFAASFIVGLGFGDTTTTTDSTSIEADTQSIYQDSTALSTQKVMSAQVVLNDLDNTSPKCKTCHNPLASQPSTVVFLDRIFGSFMFQDPAAGPPPSAAQRAAWQAQFDVPAMAMMQESRRQRFSDVDAASPEKVAIGMVTRLGIMMGYRDGKFHPNDPMTRAQLAVALRRMLHPAHPKTPPTFSDLSSESPVYEAVAEVTAAGLMTPSASRFDPAVAVSHDEFRSVLSHAFKSAPSQAASGEASLTRGDAAQLLLTVLQAQQ
jgi:hypothetical protein